MTIRAQIDPNIKASGAALTSMMENLKSDDMKDIVSRHFTGEVDTEAWYPAEIWFNIFDDIKKEPGATSNLVAIGMSVVNTAIMPPGLDNADLPTLLGAWDTHYHMNHRGDADIGNVMLEEVSPTHLKVILTTIYPDDLCYGMTYAYARRSLPEGTYFTVKYDKTEPRLDEGGEKTVIHVTWE